MSQAVTANQSWIEKMTKKIAETPIGQSTPITLGIVATLLGAITIGAFQAGRLSEAVTGIGLRVSTLETQRATDSANQATTNMLLGSIKASLEDVKQRVQNIENRPGR